MSSNPKIMIAIAKQIKQLETSAPEGKCLFHLPISLCDYF